MRCCCERADRSGLKRLERVVHDENRARAAGDHVVRLSGDFHRVLAELAGNQPLTQLMHGLTVCILPSWPTVPVPGTTCREDEHEKIVQAIGAGDVRRAMNLMTEHLEHIESALNEPGPPSDLADLLPAPGPGNRQPRPRHEDRVLPTG